MVETNWNKMSFFIWLIQHFLLHNDVEFALYKIDNYKVNIYFF
ncbi:hypothetical protein PAMA111031_05540 [Paraphotobacterium marinum]